MKPATAVIAVLAMVNYCAATTPQPSAPPKLKDDAPKEVREIYDRRDSILKFWRTGRQQELVAELKRLSKIRGTEVNPKTGTSVSWPDENYSFRTVEDKKRALATQTAVVERLKAETERLKTAVIEPPFEQQLKVGTITFAWVSHINQVIDKNTVIAQLTPLQVWQLGSGRLMGAPGIKEVWLTGCDTSSLVDDLDTTTVIPIYITSTKTYQTAIGGTRTILRAERFDQSKYLVKP